MLKPTSRDHLYFKLLLTGPRPVSEDGKPFPTGKEMPWFFVAWTTTPFTIPANRALAVSASTHYAVLRASLKGPRGGDEEIWIVGERCVNRLLEALQGAGEPWDVLQIGTLPGSCLEHQRCANVSSGHLQSICILYKLPQLIVVAFAALSKPSAADFAGDGDT